QPALYLDHLDAAIDALASQELGHAVAETPGSHSSDSIAAESRMPGDRRHRRREDLDAAPPLSLPKRRGRFRGHEEPMVQFRNAPGGFAPGALRSYRSIPPQKVTHGQAMRDLRQGAAVRTPRQSRQEPGQPE